MSTQSPGLKFQVIHFRIKKLIWGAIDWLFPPVCAGCGVSGHRFCPDCCKATRKVNPRICVFCGKRLSETVPVHSCPRQTFIDRGIVWGIHEGKIRKGLHRLKYQRDLGLADTFSALLTETYLDSQVYVDLIVPVPLGSKRLKERGYNQAQLLAFACAGKLGIRCLPSAIKRVRETKTQVGLSISQRHENVAGAFRADPRLVSGKIILLIDDVLTTGATLNSCAEALKQAGAEKVISLTLARAQ